MKISVTELPDVQPKQNPLLSSPQYACQLAGSSLFFLVMSGLTENPVKVILHDKFSGKRQLLTIETAKELTAVIAPPPPVKQPLIRKVERVVIAETIAAPPPAAPKLSIGIPKASPSVAPPAAVPVPTGLKLSAPRPQVVQSQPFVTSPKLFIKK